MIYTPSGGPEGWRALLADPEKHWRTGYSAKALAYCWAEAKGFPKGVSEAFQRVAGRFTKAEFLLGIPEHKVYLPPLAGRPSQNDLFVLARFSDGLISIMVEGKVSEPFGDPVSVWRVDGPSSGKEERLAFLCKLLELPEDRLGAIRYQLLHRSASALIEAQRFHAKYALMLVHSFSQAYEHFEDYAAFVQLLGAEGATGCDCPRGSERWGRTLRGMGQRRGGVSEEVGSRA